MGRQLLTFVIVFLAMIVLFKYGCSGEAPRHGLSVERPEDAGEGGSVLRSKDGNAEAHLSADGSVVRIAAGNATIMRPVPATRRPFHLFLGNTGEPVGVEGGWQAEDVPGGRRYVCAKDKLRIEKTVRLSEDGSALLLDLKAEGVPDDALVLTGASGLELDETSFGYWQLDDKDPRTQSLAALVQAREEAHDGPYAMRSESLKADAKVRRFGAVGSAFSLSLEDLPLVSRLFGDAYRAERDGSETEELETWVEIVAPGGKYEGTFTLRWRTREEAAKTFGSATSVPEQQPELEDDTFKVVFTNRGASIVRMYLKGYSTVAGEELSEKTWVPILGGFTREGERALTLSAEGHGGDPAHDAWEFKVADDKKSIRFTLTLPDGWKLAKRISLPEKGRFDLGVVLEVEAPQGATAKEISVSLVGPSGSYIVDSYRGIIGADPPAAFILDRGGDEATQPVEKLGEILDRSYVGDRRGLFLAIGTRGAYFVVALVSEDVGNAVTSTVAKRIQLTQEQKREDGKPPTRDSMLGRVAISLSLDGGRGTQKFRLYAGPNELEALRALDIGQSVNFGMFGFIGRALMWLMKALHGLVGSFGVAIMLMTMIVRALLLPISYRTQLSMQRYGKRLQKIKPLLDEIQKKHAKDPQKMNRERMQVMREHGVGIPLGCLTLFLQIPIWFALFQALRVEFALRHQPFLYVADLSMPDRLFGLPAFDFWLLSWLPHWFNLLPILMLVLWVLQQKLAPAPGSDDPQVKMQMKMMKIMPFVFFFMLYNYAAGLALYMCVSSVWTIAESKLVKRAIARHP